MALISTALSAIIVVLNSIGLEMYTKLCYKSMIPTRENLITSNQNDTDASGGRPSSNTLNWIGDCGKMSLFSVRRHMKLYLCYLFNRSSIFYPNGHCGFPSRTSFSDIGQLQFIHLPCSELVLQRPRKSDPGSVQKGSYHCGTLN